MEVVNNGREEGSHGAVDNGKQKGEILNVESAAI